MTKKVLILSSSPRRGGNSDTLCDRFLAGAKEAGHVAEKVFLGDKNIAYCTGCGGCIKSGRCSQKDDMAALLDRMVEADVIVMATPVYFYTMAGQMKTFIDRCCARYRELGGKSFWFLLTAADGNRKAMNRTVEGFRGFTSCLDDPKESGVIYGLGAWHKGDIQGNAAMDAAYQAGRSF